MGCSFRVLAVFLAIVLIAPATLAHASDFCLPRNDKPKIEAVESYFDATLREHEKFIFSRSLIRGAKDNAKAILVQQILDKQAQICGDKLKFEEDLKEEPKHWATAECSSDGLVGVINAYMQRIAQYYDENQKELLVQQNRHVRLLRDPLIEIAKGSTIGLEKISVNGRAISSLTPSERLAWATAEATKLVLEAKTAWGSMKAELNPLVQQNHRIALEAIRARNLRDSMKKNLKADGVPAPSCVRKP